MTNQIEEKQTIENSRRKCENQSAHDWIDVNWHKNRKTGISEFQAKFFPQLK